MLPARWSDKYEAEVFGSPDWVATVKVDGHRCLVVRQPCGTVEMFSRAGKRMMSAEKVFRNLPLAVGTMLDCELVIGDLAACQCERKNRNGGWDVVAHFRAEHPEGLKLVVLDVMFVNGESVMDTPFANRWHLAQFIVERMDDSRVEAVETKPRDVPLDAWLAALNGRGEEGVVFKRRDSLYESGKRTVRWLKRKWELETYDVVILRTLPPSEKMDPSHRRLAYGWADGKEVGVAPMSGQAEEMKELVGQVMEVKANAVMPSGALLYPRFVRMRPDKMPEECERP